MPEVADLWPDRNAANTGPASPLPDLPTPGLGGEQLEAFIEKIVGMASADKCSRSRWNESRGRSMGNCHEITPASQALECRDRIPKDDGSRIVTLRTAKPMLEHPRLSVPYGQ